MALDQYNQAGQDLMDQYALLGAQEEQAYGRYMDQLDAYYAERDRLQSLYDAERDYDYGKWADERNFAYQQERDAAADAQWQAEYDEAVRQWNALHGGDVGGTSAGNGAGDPGIDPEETEEPTDGDTVVINGVSYTRDQIEAAQKYLNIPVTGEWDSASVSAAKKKGYGHLGAVMDAMQEHDGDHALDYLQSNGSIYDQLLGAVSTSKGLYSKNNPDERQAAYKEALDIVNEAYKNGLITAEQRASLLRVATPASR